MRRLPCRRARADALAPTRDLLIGGVNLFPASFTEVRVNYPVQTQDAGIRHHHLLANFQFGF